MRCGEVNNRLSDYRHSRLNDWEMVLVQEHLAGCSACDRQYQLEQLGGAILAVTREEVTPPPFFKTRVMAQISELQSKADRRSLVSIWWEAVRQYSPAMLAVMLLILTLTVITRETNNNTVPGMVELGQLSNSGNEEALFTSEEVSDDEVSRRVLPGSE